MSSPIVEKGHLPIIRLIVADARARAEGTSIRKQLDNNGISVDVADSILRERARKPTANIRYTTDEQRDALLHEPYPSGQNFYTPTIVSVDAEYQPDFGEVESIVRDYEEPTYWGESSPAIIERASETNRFRGLTLLVKDELLDDQTSGIELFGVRANTLQEAKALSVGGEANPTLGLYGGNFDMGGLPARLEAARNFLVNPSEAAYRLLHMAVEVSVSDGYYHSKLFSTQMPF